MPDDERFSVPSGRSSPPVEGRPTVPVATYLRMMYLKPLYGLGYKSLAVRQWSRP